jgi:hypothetical protein
VVRGLGIGGIAVADLVCVALMAAVMGLALAYVAGCHFLERP